MLTLNLPDAIALLRRTPSALDALLRGLPDTWTRCNEGANTWSAYDAVGHMLHVERADWMLRVRHLLEHGETRPFPVLDRTAQFQQSQGRSLEELLDGFAAARTANIAAVEAMGLTPEDLARRGLHPKLGAVTLGNLLSTWTVHDLTHLHQISRVMAVQYKDAVGPWIVFLGVMQCAGHSA